MKFTLVIPGPLDRRSGGYSYDTDLVAHLESQGHEVAVWSLPLHGKELAARLVSAEGVVIFDALVHAPLVQLLERARPRSRAVWVALVHHLAWLDDPAQHQIKKKKEGERRFLETMDAFVFNSLDTRKTVRELRGPAPYKPSVVCRPPLGAVPAPSTPTGQGRLLFLGNLLPRKNLHGLLEALSLLQARRPELPWKLTIAGSGALDLRYARRCRTLAKRLKPGRIEWTGRVSDNEREALWARTDLLALPSFHEGWGMAHAEALVRGIPALAVPRGGVLEVLGDAAVWSEPDADSLSRVLETYLTTLVEERARRARHRGAALAAQTGFAALPAFWRDLQAFQKPISPPPFDFGEYLEAKATVDDRSLHPRVWAAAFAEAPRSVIELGGGTGTMARRLRASGHVSAETDYLLVDQQEAGLAQARERSAGLFAPGRFQTRQADLLAFWKAPATAPDLVIAHALLDLFDPRAAAPQLARMGAKRYWLTHLFDGLTAWEPVLDPALDDAILAAYHRSMDERAPGGAQGSSRSGRDWLIELPRAGLRVVDAASADWIVRPEGGVYPAAEARFLHSLLHFFRSSLAGRSDVDQAGLQWWLTVRAAQIDSGETVFLARQLDLAAELVSEAAARPGRPGAASP